MGSIHHIFKSIASSQVDGAGIFISNTGNLNLHMPKSLLIGWNDNLTVSQKLELFKTWLASNNITMQYPLATPLTYQIKQYGETYNGVVWNKNEPPSSLQYYTNIYNTAGLEMQCEIRKLGNRAMAYYDLATSSGEVLQTITGNNNINCFYAVPLMPSSISNLTLFRFKISGTGFIGIEWLNGADVKNISLSAGSYTFSSNMQINSGTPLEIRISINSQIAYFNNGSSTINFVLTEPKILTASFRFKTTAASSVTFFQHKAFKKLAKNSLNKIYK